MADVRTALTVALACRESSSSLQGFGSQRSWLEHGRTYTLTMLDGTDANESDMVYSVSTTVGTGAPDNYDLAGSLASLLTGSTLTYAEVTAVVVINESTTPGESISVGGGITNPISSMWGAAGDLAVVGPGGVFVLTSPIDGYSITGGSADILRINTTAASVGYRLIIIGRSA